ncbi:flagellar filament capping protein FliD [Ramlibacter sp. AW1]|uniref:Flagellar hook-associated protein 2 n=1 Tax=Ramlibacter aurantiacus TaxID=2801330 RepID=A0A937D7Y0_9BURK|nr:flagellar filament capping protein FliD [Ramlibacter aurantiacus]MBL0421446.1 flagellar filament capping protein FliD [Ramlibacter aurantiacus]
MPSITSTGVGSGLDVNSIVTSLMALEQRPLALLQQRASSLQTRLSAFGTLQGQAAALGDVAKRLATASNWNPMRLDSSRPEALTATASGAAAAGRYRIEVQQLAQAQSLASAAFAGSDTVVGTGTLTLELGSTVGGVFTPASGATAMRIAIGPGQQTLAGVRDAINAADAGVQASIVTSAGQARLVLRGPQGEQGSMRLTAADEDGGDTDTAGLSALAFDPAATAGAGRNLVQTQAAQDALFTVDGLDVRSASNEAANVIEGVTLTLRQVTTTPLELTASVDTGGVRKNLNDLVNAYNSLAKVLAQQTQADPSGRNRGALQADSTAVSMQNGLRELLRGVVQGLPEPASLSAVGLEMQRDGTLTIKEATLAPLLEQPGRLAALFTQAGSDEAPAARGLAVRLKAWAQAVTGDDGTLSSRLQGLRGSATANQKQQDALQDKLARTEARLRAQYQRLDSDMSRLSAQMAQLRSSLGLGS